MVGARRDQIIARGATGSGGAKKFCAATIAFFQFLH
jgi:hypothetical protein